MLDKNEISFITFLLYQLAEAWHMSPSGVYKKLSEQIQSGKYGIENMDYKYLADVWVCQMESYREFEKSCLIILHMSQGSF